MGHSLSGDDQMHAWVQEPHSLPTSGRNVRFAVGLPGGPSSNSWIVTTSKQGDIYIAGRDNFREVKTSLHKSGIWRFAHISKAATDRPDLLDADGNRLIDSWKAPVGWRSEPVVAFRVALLTPALYLSPEQRGGWKRSVVFVEPPTDRAMMTVISVCVIPDGQDFDYRDATGGKVAVLDLVEGVRVHVLATWAPEFNFGAQELATAVTARAAELSDRVSEHGVALLHGHDDDGVRLLVPIPLSYWASA
jgi:hypothetical protein